MKHSISLWHKCARFMRQRIQVWDRSRGFSLECAWEPSLNIHWQFCRNSMNLKNQVFEVLWIVSLELWFWIENNRIFWMWGSTIRFGNYWALPQNPILRTVRAGCVSTLPSYSYFCGFSDRLWNIHEHRRILASALSRLLQTFGIHEVTSERRRPD